MTAAQRHCVGNDRVFITLHRYKAVSCCDNRAEGLMLSRSDRVPASNDTPILLLTKYQTVRLAAYMIKLTAPTKQGVSAEAPLSVFDS